MPEASTWHALGDTLGAHSRIVADITALLLPMKIEQRVSNTSEIQFFFTRSSPDDMSASFDAYECFSFLPMAIFRFVRETCVEHVNMIFMKIMLRKYMAEKALDQFLTSTSRIIRSTMRNLC